MVTLRCDGRGAARGSDAGRVDGRGGFQRYKGRGVPAGDPAGVPALEGGSSTHMNVFVLQFMAPSFIYQLPFVTPATLDIWPSLVLADGTGSKEAEVILKVQISVKGGVAKPKVVTSEIGGELDTQAIMWPATAGFSPEDWSHILFVKGKTNWYRCLSLRFKTQAPQLLVLRLPLRIRDNQKPSRQELFLCAPITAQAPKPYTHQLLDA